MQPVQLLPSETVPGNLKVLSDLLEQEPWYLVLAFQMLPASPKQTKAATLGAFREMLLTKSYFLNTAHCPSLSKQSENRLQELYFENPSQKIISM